MRLNNRTERLESIERMLFEHPLGLRAVEIAGACGVDRRTIYRDIATLIDTGLPIYQKNNRFFINRDYYLSTVRLSSNEAIALFLATRVLLHHMEQQNPHLISALAKLAAALPELPASHLSFLIETMRRNPVDRAYVAVLETMTRAWCEFRLVELWYSASGKRETSSREFAVYFLEMTPEGRIYAVGFDATARRVRTLNLRHVMRAHLLRTTYTMPEQFDPRRYLASAWETPHEDEGETAEVILVFATDAVSFIQEHSWHPWHPTQKVEMLRDGRCLLRVRIGDWRSMLPWIRSWGTQVEALKPDALRETLASEAIQATSIYHSRT